MCNELLSLLHSIHLGHRCIWITLVGETQNDLQGVLGGDSSLSQVETAACRARLPCPSAHRPRTVLDTLLDTLLPRTLLDTLLDSCLHTFLAAARSRQEGLEYARAVRLHIQEREASEDLQLSGGRKPQPAMVLTGTLRRNVQFAQVPSPLRLPSISLLRSPPRTVEAKCEATCAQGLGASEEEVTSPSPQLTPSPHLSPQVLCASDEELSSLVGEPPKRRASTISGDSGSSGVA